MIDTSLSIVQAAHRRFMRYGFNKTTMGDIAEEAGVARQTVYNAFPGKAEILRAVIKTVGEDTIVKVQAAWSTADTLDEKLEIFHRLGPICWYTAVQEAPDAAELMEGLHKSGAEELARQEEQWKALLTETIAAHVPEQRLSENSAGEVADFFHAASISAKIGVNDLAQLTRRLAVLRRATLNLLQA